MLVRFYNACRLSNGCSLFACFPVLLSLLVMADGTLTSSWIVRHIRFSTVCTLFIKYFGRLSRFGHCLSLSMLPYSVDSFMSTMSTVSAHVYNCLQCLQCLQRYFKMSTFITTYSRFFHICRTVDNSFF